MSKNFLENMFPPECRSENGALSSALIAEHTKNSYALADKITRSSEIKFQHRKTIFLVDVQGIYLALIVWMEDKQIPIADGRLLGRLAAHLLSQATSMVESRERKKLDPEGVDYEVLYRACFRKDMDKLETIKVVNRLQSNLQLFFAPFPLLEIEKRLKRTLRRHNGHKINKQIELISKGVAAFPWGERNYKFYDAFTSDIKEWVCVSRTDEGYFNYAIDDNGLKYCDEKEVDIKIAIRAMDIIMFSEADALCIVSSDQDFIPLHQRCRELDLQSYHVDVAKFDNPGKVGRKIRELGEDAIAVAMPRDLPWQIIQEYVSSPSSLDLTKEQYNALWTLHCKLYDDPYYPYGHQDS